MKPFSWDDEAARMADHVHQHMFSAHRGAMAGTHQGTIVLFGNDGYSSPKGRARATVDRLRSLFPEVLGFGTDKEESYSWALIVRGDDGHEAIEDAIMLVWDAWRESGPTGPMAEFFAKVQIAQALGAAENSVERGPSLN